jgi:hypothetical protein
MNSQIDLKKVVPGAIIGLALLGYIGNGTVNWLAAMVNNSFRSGPYEKTLAVEPPPASFPKDSYVCKPQQKTPWIGCSIR